MLRGILVALIWLYKATISPLLGTRCRFYPSCSEYAATCLRERSLTEALGLTTARLLKCHPWHPGGIDLP